MNLASQREFSRLRDLMFNILDDFNDLTSDQVGRIRERVEELAIFAHDSARAAINRVDQRPIAPIIVSGIEMMVISADEVPVWDDGWENFDDFMEEEAPMQIEELQLPIRAKSKAISEKKFNALTQDICAICHENHPMSEVFTVSCCKQHLGKECYNQWALNKRSCPCCRKESPELVTYRKYAKKRA